MAQKSGALVLIFLGMIFLSVGVGVGYFSFRTLAQAGAMKAWQEVPATVLTCDLRVSRGSKGGSTYQAKATYQYEVNGVSQTGDRVSLHSGSDNIGRFHQRVYSELKRCMDRQETTTCWVNPANSAEAILIRKPRAEMLIFMQLFVLAFGGAGLAMALSGLAGLLQSAVRSDSSVGQSQIRMRGASAHQVAGALAFVWNGYVGWFLWKVHQVTVPEVMPWYLWLMAATGVIPAVIAGYLVGRFRKFGVSSFEMSPMPGVLGGPVSGTIRIPARVETEDGFEIVLQCIHQFKTGGGKNRHTHRDVQWEDSRHIAGSQAYGDETMLPVRFTVPYDKPPTTVAGGSDGFYWQLKATAAAPGIDYKAVFDVPVKHTAQSSVTVGAERTPAAYDHFEPVMDVLNRSSLCLQPNPDGGFELAFPPRRPLSAVLSLAIFGLVWTAVCAGLWTVMRAPVFWAFLFTLIDVLVLLMLLHTLFVHRGIVVDRARRECVVWWRASGFQRRERVVPFDRITEFRSERAGQSGNTMYYRVVLAVEGGGPVTVGSGMTMWNEAEDIARLLGASIKPVFERARFCV